MRRKFASNSTTQIQQNKMEQVNRTEAAFQFIRALLDFAYEPGITSAIRCIVCVSDVSSSSSTSSSSSHETTTNTTAPPRNSYNKRLRDTSNAGTEYEGELEEEEGIVKQNTNLTLAIYCTSTPTRTTLQAGNDHKRYSDTDNEAFRNVMKDSLADICPEGLILNISSNDGVEQVVCLSVSGLGDYFPNVEQFIKSIGQYISIWQEVLCKYNRGCIIELMVRHGAMDQSSMQQDITIDLSLNCMARSSGLVRYNSSHQIRESVLDQEVMLSVLVNNVDSLQSDEEDPEWKDRVTVTFIPAINGRLLSNQNQVKSFARQCFTRQRPGESVSKTEAFFSYHTEQNQSIIKWFLRDDERSSSGQKTDEDCIRDLFLQCWTDNLMAKLGLNFVKLNGEELFWFLDDNDGLFSSISYPFHSENRDELESLSLIIHFSTSVDNGCEEYGNAANIVPDATSRLLEKLFLDLKNRACKQIFQSKREAKFAKIKEYYIPTIASSIQEICQLSSNTEFITRCLQLLDIQSVHDISGQVQSKLMNQMEQYIDE